MCFSFILLIEKYHLQIIQFTTVYLSHCLIIIILNTIKILQYFHQNSRNIFYSDTFPILRRQIIFSHLNLDDSRQSNNSIHYFLNYNWEINSPSSHNLVAPKIQFHSSSFHLLTRKLLTSKTINNLFHLVYCKCTVIIAKTVKKNKWQPS
jgi:hypothetical protein